MQTRAHPASSQPDRLPSGPAAAQQGEQGQPSPAPLPCRASAAAGQEGSVLLTLAIATSAGCVLPGRQQAERGHQDEGETLT